MDSEFHGTELTLMAVPAPETPPLHSESSRMQPSGRGTHCLLSWWPGSPPFTRVLPQAGSRTPDTDAPWHPLLNPLGRSPRSVTLSLGARALLHRCLSVRPSLSRMHLRQHRFPETAAWYLLSGGAGVSVPLRCFGVLYDHPNEPECLQKVCTARAVPGPGQSREKSSVPFVTCHPAPPAVCGEQS